LAQAILAQDQFGFQTGRFCNGRRCWDLMSQVLERLSRRLVC